MCRIRRSHTSSWLVGLGLMLLLLSLCDLMVGDTTLSLHEVWGALTGHIGGYTRTIVCSIRLVRLIVALLIGMSLAASGLVMQTLFQNPLADPYILGVSSGASLGVALFILGAPIIGVTSLAWLNTIGILGAGWIGAAVILVLIIAISRKINNLFGILIIGVMISYIVSAIIQILAFFSSAESLKLYSLWSMGTLGQVIPSQLTIMAIVLSIGLLICILCVKPLNLYLLGQEYASTMGLNIKRTRTILFTATTLLAGTVTVYCGPIGFIGLAVPHLSRLLIRRADHRLLLPASILMGAITMVLCDMIAKVILLPINAITALIGIPVILWVIIRQLKKV